jgi:hypothetical protein
MGNSRRGSRGETRGEVMCHVMSQRLVECRMDEGPTQDEGCCGGEEEDTIQSFFTLATKSPEEL